VRNRAFESAEPKNGCPKCCLDTLLNGFESLQLTSIDHFPKWKSSFTVLSVQNYSTFGLVI